MAAKIIYIIAVALECVFVPLFLKYAWPTKCKTSLIMKTIASTMFIITGVCSVFIAGKFTPYSRFIIIGLIFGMLGDILLHLLTDKQIVFAGGLFAFLIGHIFYIIAYKKALDFYTPGAKIFDWRAVIAILVILFSCIIYAIMTDMKFGIATIPVLMYAVTISIMLVTAFQLGARVFLEGFDHDVAILCTVSLGSLLFMLSDATLSILLFGGQEKNRPLKIFNILTYYAGQVLIGTSIIYIMVK